MILLGTGSTGLAQQPHNRPSEPAVSAPLPCLPDPNAGEDSDQQACLSEHIAGFGGYNYLGPCEVAAYLLDPETSAEARDLLTRYIEAASQDCGERLSIDIRHGAYNYVDLHRWGSQAGELLTGDADSMIENADAFMGPFILDNRVTFFVDPESFMTPATGPDAAIAAAKQALLAHGFDLEAFRFTSDPFSIRSLAWNFFGVSDPCVSVKPPLSVCTNIPDVQVSFVDASPTGVLGTARLRSGPGLSYIFIISWDAPVSLEEYAADFISEEDAGYALANPHRFALGEFPAIRFDLTPAREAESPVEQGEPGPELFTPKMILFIDTGAGIATFSDAPRMPGSPEATLEEIYSGAESVARILRIQH
ncbi:hypothetical protein [Altererythrobacter sp. Z27]|uniref:hypothetical protein n=1 Tax=Altererythrobacter sp. Z27 TaxID=3461147 RepID=UPI004043ADD0